ncbi:thioredoxin-like protein [Radiomyces spectabilis]|uniref:thioredoxin-like protein n=1 Tax=Radiomyces spectabilis TaxID=64574 RepID=UPI00221FB177|nr:thioredoxin-like protein [Radiomyces spectabilis]KAI8377484.1 thioredoxin-like protein [Radiomyces spectabilis]
MALAPQFAGHRLGSIAAPHTFEIYLDYVCPFSAKIYKKIREQVWPYVDKTYPAKLQLIFRQQVQPWHASSTVVHEAALAVEKIDTTKFFDFSDQLFARQAEFFDEAVENKTRKQLVDQLSEMAATVGVSADKVRELLSNGTGEPKNVGNKVSNDLKLQVKFGRQNGIHVSPTVVFDGLRDDSVSSSWEMSQWEEYFKAKL